VVYSESSRIPGDESSQIYQMDNLFSWTSSNIIDEVWTVPPGDGFLLVDLHREHLSVQSTVLYFVSVRLSVSVSESLTPGHVELLTMTSCLLVNYSP